MIRCVAIDDEPIALSIIQEYCKRRGDIELRCFTSPVQGMECIAATRPDIVFLDIEMKSHNGIALAQELPAGTCLVFTTAYANYALDGFNVDAIDFLHKPIFYQRFEHAIEKALKYRQSPKVQMPQAVLTLKAGHKNVVVEPATISYVEAMDNYVKIYRKGLTTIVSQITMKEIESMLPPGGFCRVHRSFIVSLRDIDRFSNREVYLKNCDRSIPVGRKYVQEFKNTLEQL